jgi:uncharacterized membrane protein YukC
MPPAPLYDGPDRRDPNRPGTIEDRFEAAVEVASARAAQKVARIHRVRLVKWVSIATMAISLAIMLLLWFAFLKPQEERFITRSTVYNCQQFHQVAALMSDFVMSDRNLRLYQGTKDPVQAKFIDDLNKSNIIPSKDMKAYLADSRRNQDKTLNRWLDDARKLNSIAGGDCIRTLSR